MKLMGFINIIALAFAFVGVLNFVSWLDYSDPFVNRSLIVYDLSVPPGRDLIFTTRSTTGNRYCSGATKNRWFIDSDLERRDIASIEPPLMAARSPGETIVINYNSVGIPVRMPFGRAKFCFQRHWVCSPIQRKWPIDGPVTCFDFLVTTSGIGH